MLTAINTQHTFLIVDSCFSGTLFTRGASRDLAERVERFPSRWGLTSGRSEIVADGAKGGNSPFASSIIYLLKNNIKQLGVQELCTHVIESVVADAIQTPIGEPLAISGHKGGQFIFRLKKDEARDWKETQEAGDINAYESFVALYPKGKYFEEAATILYQKKEDKLWAEAKEMNTMESFMVYKKKYPQGKYTDQFFELMENLEDAKDWKIACRQNRLSAYMKYKRNYPNGDHRAEADAKIQALQHGKPTFPEEQETVNNNISTPDSSPTEEVEMSAVGLLDNSINNETEYEHQSIEKRGTNWTGRLIMFGIPILLVVVFVISKIFTKLEENDLLSTSETKEESPIVAKEMPEPTIAELENKIKTVDSLIGKGQLANVEKEEISQKVTTKPSTEKVTSPEKTTTNTATTKPSNTRNPMVQQNPNSSKNKPVVVPPVAIPYPIVNLRNSMKQVKGGKFAMGMIGSNTAPIHTVSLRSFSISKTEVTQALWQAVMGNNPSAHKGCSSCPVENVSFYEVQDFLKKLNKMTGKKYRLPTEAEWEYAAVAGRLNDMNYQNETKLSSIAYFKGNTQKTQKVGRKAANKLGLTDMIGNVAEWCQDWYSDDFYKDGATNPINKKKGVAASKVVRGGSFLSGKKQANVFYRSAMAPRQRKKNIGFRCVLN